MIRPALIFRHYRGVVEFMINYNLPTFGFKYIQSLKGADFMCFKGQDYFMHGLFMEIFIFIETDSGYLFLLGQ